MYKPDFRTPARRDKHYLVLALPRNLPRAVRNLSVFSALLVGSNLLSLSWANGGRLPWAAEASEAAPLYLIEKARPHLSDEAEFVRKVRSVSEGLAIPPEWLMAVMYAESRFDPSVYNHRGSGAVGLIQFMPATAAELGVSPQRLSSLSAEQQLEYVYRYLQTLRERYGEYESLTDLYLAILYPRARGQDYCFTLYARPSPQYDMNAGLDQDKDGRVSISDVERHLKRLFPAACLVRKEPASSEESF